MKSKKLSLWMKGIVVALGAAGTAFFFLFVPLAGTVFLGNVLPPFAWTAIALLPALPWALMVGMCWQASCDVGEGKSFTEKNAARLKHISLCCLCDGALLLLVDVLFLVFRTCDATLPVTLLFVGLLLVVALFCLVAAATACLSAFVSETAKIREENDSFV